MSIKLGNIQEKLQPIIAKVGQNRYLKALTSGMMLALPVTMMSAFATLMKILPIPVYQDFIINNGLGKYFDVPITFTNNFMGVIVAFAVAYALGKSFEVEGFITGLISMVSFFILTPFSSSTDEWGQVLASIPMDWLGAKGMFTAIIVAFITSRLFVAITKKGIVIKMPDSVPPFIATSFTSLIPGILILTLISLVSALFSMTSYGSIHSFIYTILQAPLQGLGSGIGSVIVVAIVAQLLWFFGLHGASIVLGVIAPIWGVLDAYQLAAFSAGQELPNITGMAFYSTYTAGNLLPLAFMFAFLAKSSRYKTLGKIAIIPSIFTIGEAIAYGAPLVMNFIFAIPYIFTDAITLALAYFFTSVGILPRVGGVGTPMGTPVIISGFLQGSWKIALFQAILLVVRFIIWYIFFKIADKAALNEESKTELANA